MLSFKQMAVLAMISIGLGWFSYHAQIIKKIRVVPLNHAHVVSRKKLISHVKFRTPHPISTCCGYPEFDVVGAENFNQAYHFAEKFCHKGVAIDFKTQQPICIH